MLANLTDDYVAVIKGLTFILEESVLNKIYNCPLVSLNYHLSIQSMATLTVENNK